MNPYICTICHAEIVGENGISANVANVLLYIPGSGHGFRDASEEVKHRIHAACFAAYAVGFRNGIASVPSRDMEIHGLQQDLEKAKNSRNYWESERNKEREARLALAATNERLAKRLRRKK